MNKNRPALSILAASFKRGRPFADVLTGEGEGRGARGGEGEGEGGGGRWGKADEEEEEELKDVHGLRAALLELRAICLGPELVRGWRYSGTCVSPTPLHLYISTSPRPYGPTSYVSQVSQSFSPSVLHFILFNDVYFKFNYTGTFKYESMQERVCLCLCSSSSSVF